jgi:multiple sugar transport system permease protein
MRYGRGRRILLWLIPFGLISVALALRIFTGFIPFAETVKLSFYDSNPTYGADLWIGADNYRDLSSDITVRDSIFFTIMFTFGSTLAEVVLGIALGLLLNARFKLRGIARTVCVIAWAIPVVVVGSTFKYGLDPDFGLLANLWTQATGTSVNWLLDPWLARLAVIAANVWVSVPFVAIIMLAALQAIPTEVYEAAKVDGSRGWTLFRTITLPLIAPIVITIAVFFLNFQIAAFDMVLAMTQGGPGTTTAVLGYKAYSEGFQGLNFGYGAAITVVLFAFVVSFGVVGTLIMRRIELRS